MLIPLVVILLSILFTLARMSAQTHPLTVFTSILIFSTAQRENKSQLIQALYRGNQIPAQAWQTTSKFLAFMSTERMSLHFTF